MTIDKHSMYGMFAYIYEPNDWSEGKYTYHTLAQSKKLQ